jgi:hypothetical protein
MATSTSFRISARAKSALTTRATEDGTSATSLLEQLIVEGIAARDFPGVIYRGPVSDRRAALAAGPDVWEVVARLQELRGAEEHRLRVISDETGVPVRLLRLALDFAAAHPDEIETRITRKRAAIETSRRNTAARSRLLA